jgi:omega-amidase
MINVGIIQTQTYRTNKEGITRISKILEELGKKKTEIVCLPEQWLKNIEIYDFDSEFLEFKEIAKKYQMTIIPGAFYEKIKKDLTISSPIIGPKGNIIGKQEKIHPYDYEKNIITPGKEIKIFNTACKFVVLICYDMVFPKVSETAIKKGAQIIFSPSRIVKRGINPWETYIQARSLENRVPILAANVKNKKYGGNSMIVDLFEDNKVMIPKIIKIKEEGYALKKINLKKFEKNRKIRFSDSKNFV